MRNVGPTSAAFAGLAGAIALTIGAPLALAQGPSGTAGAEGDLPAQVAPPPERPAYPVVVAPPRPPTHPAQETGWGHTLVTDQPLWAYPNPQARRDRRVGSPGDAGRVGSVRRGADGRIWVRFTVPGRVAGWLPGEDLEVAPAPARLSAATVATLRGATAALRTPATVLVRDPYGRTLFHGGTDRPLVLASVTKLATMAAVLERMPVAAGTASAVLGSSNNAIAQYLSNRIGSGSARGGAAVAMRTAARFGARFHLVDGSGLMPSNRARARDVAQLLAAMRDRPRFATFYRGLSVAGRSGTLGGRMIGTSAAARARGKTGTLFVPPASAFAGYVWPAGAPEGVDHALVVVIISNGLHYLSARPLQDRILRALTARGAVVEGRQPDRARWRAVTSARATGGVGEPGRNRG